MPGAFERSESFQRSLWRRVEAIHAVTYFGQETRDAALEAGLTGFWMGYFGFRAAPLGTASVDEVRRTFFNFSPAFIARWVPDVWDRGTPLDLVGRRSAAAAATLRRVSRHADATCADTERWLDRLVDESAEIDRPLYDANRTVVPPADPVERLWQAMTLMREHRGDGHIAGLVAGGLDGCEALVLMSAAGDIEPERFRQSRGWTVAEWSDAEQRLVDRRLLASPGVIGHDGAELRADIEATTDRLAEAITAGLSSAERASLMRRLDRLASDIVGSDLIPFPNPIGLPDPRR